MSVNKIFKLLLGLCIFPLIASPLFGIAAILAVLILWGITLLILSKIGTHALESSRAKYSHYYVRDEEKILPINKKEGEQNPTALMNLVDRETWSMPFRIDSVTKCIDGMLTPDAMIYVYLVNERAFKETDWLKLRENVQTTLSNKSTRSTILALLLTLAEILFLDTFLTKLISFTIRFLKTTSLNSFLKTRYHGRCFYNCA